MMVDEVVTREFTITRSGSPLTLRYCGNVTLNTTRTNRYIEYLIIRVHGLSRTAQGHWESARNDARDLGLNSTANDSGVGPTHKVAIVCPQFLIAADQGSPEIAPTYTVTFTGSNLNLNNPILYWEASNWESGAYSGTSSYSRPWRIGCYEAMDELLIKCAALYPNLKRVAICGHSAGGQLAARYPFIANLPFKPHTYVFFGIANPSSHPYMDTLRPIKPIAGPVEFTTPLTDWCEGGLTSTYDRWKYGTSSWNTTATSIEDSGLPWSVMRQTYNNRNIVYFMGLLDNDPNDVDLDTSCSGMVQGEHRLTRHEAYVEHVKNILGWRKFNKSRIVYAETIHTGGALYNSPCGHREIYNLDLAAADAFAQNPERFSDNFESGLGNWVITGTGTGTVTQDGRRRASGSSSALFQGQQIARTMTGPTISGAQYAGRTPTYSLTWAWWMGSRCTSTDTIIAQMSISGGAWEEISRLTGNVSPENTWIYDGKTLSTGSTPAPGYGGLTQTSSAAATTGAQVISMRRVNNSATEDPGAITFSGTGATKVFNMIAVAPWGVSEWYTYIPGTLPIIVESPHDGDIQPAYMANRIGETGQDTYLNRVTDAMADRMQVVFGHRPHLIQNHLHRIKCDFNRPIDGTPEDASQGDRNSEAAHTVYNAICAQARAEVTAQYGKGFFMDMHGYATLAGCGTGVTCKIQCGYLLGEGDIDETDATLNGSTYINKSSIKNLGSTVAIPFSELVRGPYSYGTLLYNEGVSMGIMPFQDVVPSVKWPEEETNENYRSGQYMTTAHGSRDGGVIDAMQVETDTITRRDLRTEHAIASTSVLNTYFTQHYGINLSAVGNYTPTVLGTSAPVVSSITQTTFATDATAHLVLMPATAASGDLLLLLYTSDGAPTLTIPTGWTELYNLPNGTVVRGAAYARVSNGTEGGTTVNVVSSVAENGAAQVYRITNWSGSLGGLAWGTAGAVTTGSSVDIPPLTPAFGQGNTMWIPVIHTSTAQVVSETGTPTVALRFVADVVDPVGDKDIRVDDVRIVRRFGL